MIGKYTDSGARFSTDAKYRYLLWREWKVAYPGVPGKTCLFVMLNSSTATGETDDPTVARCVDFADRWLMNRIEIVNLFAFRASRPAALFAAAARGEKVVGVENQDYVTRAAFNYRTTRIVCAWGAHGSFLAQDEVMRGWLGDLPRYALGFTKAGHPRHPLYIKADIVPVLMPSTLRATA